MTNFILFLLIIFIYFPVLVLAGFFLIAILGEMYDRRMK